MVARSDQPQGRRAPASRSSPACTLFLGGLKPGGCAGSSRGTCLSSLHTCHTSHERNIVLDQWWKTPTISWSSFKLVKVLILWSQNLSYTVRLFCCKDKKVALELSYLTITDTGRYKSQSILFLCIIWQILVRSAKSTCWEKQDAINFTILKSYHLWQTLFFFFSKCGYRCWRK